MNINIDPDEFAELDVRTDNVLSAAGYGGGRWGITNKELEALADRSNEGLLGIKGFGHGCLLDMAIALEINGSIKDALEWCEYKYWESKEQKRFGKAVERLFAIRERKNNNQ